MQEYIALDAHKHYTLAERDPSRGGRARQRRIEHRPGVIRAYLSDVEVGTTVAVEATGNWYWIVDEIEAAECRPALVHPRKAKLMLGCINKTDRLDVHGMNQLQRTGTLPTVWIPPGAIRDERDLPRTRMFVVRHRTRLKNRILSHFTRYGLDPCPEASDAFGVGARKQMEVQLGKLPPVTRSTTEALLKQLDFVDGQSQAMEKQIREKVQITPDIQRLMTMPGVGSILGIVISLEVGDVRRFPTASHLASYAGTTPRVHASGGKVRYGPLRPDVNRYLKWAFLEAANGVCLRRRRYPHAHASRLYNRVASRKGHPKAIGAVARHLAEAAFYVLSKQEDYREPKTKLARSTTT
jgi:transposase